MNLTLIVEENSDEESITTDESISDVSVYKETENPEPSLADSPSISEPNCSQLPYL